MSADEARIELLIDVFDLAAQRALALGTLTPPQLVAAVLEEFSELEFLGNNRADYVLLKAADQAALDESAPIGDQLAKGDRLILAERVPTLPNGTSAPSRPVYLREQASGKVFQLHWQPAIIGRPDQDHEHNARLAVNLADHPGGQRVSRRQAQIGESGGMFFIEPLSSNPTIVRDGQGQNFPAQSRQPLRHGDVVYLENSQIALKFIVREPGAHQ
jgi:hypothetical protein